MTDFYMKTYHATIMIVDDDPNDLMLIEHAFRKIGVTDPIQPVLGGREAIAYIMGEGKYADRKTYVYPTFICTDLKMPEVDGFAVLEHLKNNPEWAVIPTVVLTSSRDLDDIKKAYMLGASSYHVKPGSAEALRAQLKVLHEYWMTCEVPQVDSSGRQLQTESRGKLGERFKQADPAGADRAQMTSGLSGSASAVDAAAPIQALNKFSFKAAAGKSRYTVVHQLGTTDVIVQTRIKGRIREGGIVILDENTIQLDFGGTLHEDIEGVIVG